MDDKSYRNLALLIGGAIVLYWIFKRKNKTDYSPMPLFGNVHNPELETYGANPSAFGPSGQINVDIGNQGLNYLDNKLVPLFGFVGMAQGATW